MLGLHGNVYLFYCLYLLLVSFFLLSFISLEKGALRDNDLLYLYLTVTVFLYYSLYGKLNCLFYTLSCGLHSLNFFIYFSSIYVFLFMLSVVRTPTLYGTQLVSVLRCKIHFGRCSTHMSYHFRWCRPSFLLLPGSCI